MSGQNPVGEFTQREGGHLKTARCDPYIQDSVSGLEAEGGGTGIRQESIPDILTLGPIFFFLTLFTIPRCTATVNLVTSPGLRH